MDGGGDNNGVDHRGMPDEYDDRNRAFLQAFISRGSLNFKDGQDILAAILSAADPRSNPIRPDSITRDVFNNYVQTAHEALLPLDMDIRSTQHQKTRERVWALVNVEGDPATQMATIHSPDEIAFINRLLDLMFETQNTARMEVMAVDGNQAVKVSKPPRPGRESNANGEETQTQADKGLRHSEVLTLLENLLAEGWLEKSRAGFYSLTPRALMELKTWLVETYNENDGGNGAEQWQPIKFCEFCKEIVTVGQRCEDRDCLTRIHEICLDAYWETRPEKTCPRCEKVWSGRHYVGEKAVTSTDAYKRGRRSSHGGRHRNRAQEEEDEEDGEEEE